jgi:hypothetical protein
MLKLKSKALFVVASLMVAGALVGAQASQPKVKNVKRQVTFAQDVKVGSTVLKSGKYEVASSDQGLTFKRLVADVTLPNQWNYDMKEKPVVVKCKVTVLDAKVKGTRMDMPPDSAGVPVLKTVTLDDTNVTFTIEQ